MTEIITSRYRRMPGTARLLALLRAWLGDVWAPHELILATAAFVVMACNFAFFERLFAVYPVSVGNVAFLASVVTLQFSLLVLLLLPFTHSRVVKPVLVAVLLLSAVVSYFADEFGVVIDRVMLRSIIDTNPGEVYDLLNPWLALRIVAFGFLPAAFVMTRNLVDSSFFDALKRNTKAGLACVVIIVAMLAGFSANYAAFFREHKSVRMYANPIAPLVSLTTFLVNSAKATPTTIRPVGVDARIATASRLPRLVVLVVGEAVRSESFGLNGYERQTTPRLAGEDVFNFTNFSSCGTATAVSVPCMFSFLPREDFSIEEGFAQENVLDVLRRAGVSVAWRDNNSDSKGVALRVQYDDYSSDEVNSVCDDECRDEGMLVGLEESLAQGKSQDTLLVLHQMGNHGPAYYKRYPQSFETFKPVCKSSDLATCSTDEIINAYDNALLYTDYFLGRVLDLLKRESRSYQTAMIYVSDHGESLGEFGVYLHGLPYSIAPDTQTHVPMVMWFGEKFEIDRGLLAKAVDRPFSHDNIAHTLLDLFDVNTTVRKPAQSMLAQTE